MFQFFWIYISWSETEHRREFFPCRTHLDKTFIKTKIVPNRVLPPLFVLLKIWKLRGDVLIDFWQCCPLRLTRLNGHGDQRHVGVGRFTLVTRCVIGCGSCRLWLRRLTGRCAGCPWFFNRFYRCVGSITVTTSGENAGGWNWGVSGNGNTWNKFEKT